jgi:hypothetical protein
MTLKIRNIFADYKPIVATLIGFISINLIATILLVGSFVFLGKGFSKANDIGHLRLILVVFYFVFLNPAILLSTLFLALRYIKTNDPYSFSLLIGVIATTLLGIIGFFIVPNYSGWELIMNFASITALILIWTILFQSTLSYKNVLTSGYFVYMLLFMLISNSKPYILGNKLITLKIILEIIGVLIASAVITKLFEITIKNTFKLLRIQIIDK